MKLGDSTSRVAFVEEHLAGKLVSLLTARCYDEIVEFLMEAAFFGHPALEKVTERSIALGHAVLESEYRVVSEKLCGDLSNALLGESLWSRISCREGYYFRI